MKETNAFVSSHSPTPLSPSALGASASAEDLGALELYVWDIKIQRKEVLLGRTRARSTKKRKHERNI